MQTEGALNPIPIIVHVVAIAAGLFVGWIVMDRITPDLPSASDPTGLESSIEPAAVAGDDLDSIFLPNNMSTAMLELQDREGSDQRVASLHIEPGSIEIETTDNEAGFTLPEVPVAAPLRIGDHIQEARPKLGLGQIAYMDLIATEKGPVWYVQIDINATDEPPPWTYTAALEANAVSPGGPPKPIDE